MALKSRAFFPEPTGFLSVGLPDWVILSHVETTRSLPAMSKTADRASDEAGCHKPAGRSGRRAMNVGGILKGKQVGVVSVSRDASLQHVAETLAEHKIGAVVVRGEDDKLVGIISERDIIRSLASHGSEVMSARVSTAMTRDVMSCAREESIDRVMERMTDGRFRHMPVYDGAELVGIISIGDVVKHHIAEVESEATALKTYLVSG
jgi:CBS domain-containing protein